MAGLLEPGGLLVIVHFIDWATINDTHRKAGSVVEYDMMPDFPAMREMMELSGFSVTMFADDDLGYLLALGQKPGEIARSILSLPKIFIPCLEMC